MRMDQYPSKDPNKSNSNASTKITSVVHKVLFPLATAPVGTCVSFQVKDIDEVNQQYFETLQEQHPDAFENKDAFLTKMSEFYESSVLAKI